MTKKRALDNAEIPQAKRPKNTISRRLFKNNVGFCQSVISSLLNLAQQIETGQKETVDVDSNFCFTRSGMSPHFFCRVN